MVAAGLRCISCLVSVLYGLFLFVRAYCVVVVCLFGVSAFVDDCFVCVCVLACLVVVVGFPCAAGLVRVCTALLFHCVVYLVCARTCVVCLFDCLCLGAAFLCVIACVVVVVCVRCFICIVSLLVFVLRWCVFCVRLNCAVAVGVFRCFNCFCVC